MSQQKEIKPGAATPHETLLEQIMNPCIPKSEREWAAAREIERLSESIAKAAQGEEYEAEYVDSFDPSRAIRGDAELVMEAQDAIAKVRAAQVLVGALEKDAERYRWLRGRHWSDGGMCVVGNSKLVKLGAYCPCGDGLDDAVDSAMNSVRSQHGQE